MKDLARALGEYEAAPSSPAAEAYFTGERPITLLYDDIEALWAAIAERDDWSAFEAKLAEIERCVSLWGGVVQDATNKVGDVTLCRAPDHPHPPSLRSGTFSRAKSAGEGGSADL